MSKSAMSCENGTRTVRCLRRRVSCLTSVLSYECLVLVLVSSLSCLVLNLKWFILPFLVLSYVALSFVLVLSCPCPCLILSYMWSYFIWSYLTLPYHLPCIVWSLSLSYLALCFIWSYTSMILSYVAFSSVLPCPRLVLSCLILPYLDLSFVLSIWSYLTCYPLSCLALVLPVPLRECR